MLHKDLNCEGRPLPQPRSLQCRQRHRNRRHRPRHCKQKISHLKTRSRLPVFSGSFFVHGTIFPLESVFMDAFGVPTAFVPSRRRPGLQNCGAQWPSINSHLASIACAIIVISPAAVVEVYIRCPRGKFPGITGLQLNSQPSGQT